MNMSASTFENRVTVYLTTLQHDYLRAGMRRHQIGLSEYLRRVLDRVLEQDAQQRRSLGGS